MKEFDIRPANLFEEYLRLSANDVKKYFYKNDERFERDCPACGKDEAKPVFKKNNFQFVACVDCDTLYVNPCPTPTQLSKFYQDSPSQKYWANTFYPSVAKARREKIIRPKAKKIAKLYNDHMTKAGLVVDVGAGAGDMLKELKKYKIGKDYLAIEPTREMVQFCRASDLRVFEGFAENAAKDKNLQARASLTMSFEVIEHVISPASFFTDLKLLCKPGGLILVTGLCGSGFDIQILGEISKAVSPPHHLNFLSQMGVSKLLERCGLEEISFTTPGLLDVDIVRNQYNVDPKSIKDKFISNILRQKNESIIENLQQFITRNNLSSHMWIVARKPS